MRVFNLINPKHLKRYNRYIKKITQIQFNPCRSQTWQHLFSRPQKRNILHERTERPISIQLRTERIHNPAIQQQRGTGRLQQHLRNPGCRVPHPRHLSLQFCRVHHQLQPDHQNRRVVTRCLYLRVVHWFEVDTLKGWFHVVLDLGAEVRQFADSVEGELAKLVGTELEIDFE